MTQFKKPINRVSWYGSMGKVRYYVYKDYGNRIKKLKMGFKTKSAAEKYRRSLRK